MYFFLKIPVSVYVHSPPLTVSINHPVIMFPTHHVSTIHQVVGLAGAQLPVTGDTGETRQVVPVGTCRPHPVLVGHEGGLAVGAGDTLEAEIISK